MPVVFLELFQGFGIGYVNSVDLYLFGVGYFAEVSYSFKQFLFKHLGVAHVSDNQSIFEFRLMFEWQLRYLSESFNVFEFNRAKGLNRFLSRLIIIGYRGLLNSRCLLREVIVRFFFCCRILGLRRAGRFMDLNVLLDRKFLLGCYLVLLFFDSFLLALRLNRNFSAFLFLQF